MVQRFELRYVDIVQMMRFRFTDSYKPNKAQSEIIDGIVAHQAHLLPYGILDQRFRVMHFLSQAAHETDQFNTLEEYASGQAYEGREDLGNTEPGDGQRYKGRGIFMLTGRHNYREAGKRLDLPLEAEPEIASETEVSVQTAGDYWHSRNINSVADGDDAWNVEQVTRLINGGMNGYQDRLSYFMAAGKVDWPLTAPELPPEPKPPLPRPEMPEEILKAFQESGAMEIRQEKDDLVYIYWNPLHD